MIITSGIADQLGEPSQGFRPGAVVHPHASLCSFEQSGLMQHLEVVADCRLGELKGICHIADTRLPALVRGDQ